MCLMSFDLFCRSLYPSRRKPYTLLLLLLRGSCKLTWPALYHYRLHRIRIRIYFLSYINHVNLITFSVPAFSHCKIVDICSFWSEIGRWSKDSHCGCRGCYCSFCTIFVVWEKNGKKYHLLV